MKRIKLIAYILIFVFTVFSSACHEDPPIVNPPCTEHVDDNNDKLCDLCGDKIEKTELNTPPEPEVVVKSKVELIQIKDEEINNYNYKNLFIITEDGKNVQILDEYIDLSRLKSESGVYTITCNYKEKSSNVNIEVKKTNYNVLLYVEEITINVSLVETYDYLSLFVATKDGKSMKITEDMIQNNVLKEAGSYTYIVTNHGITAALKVNVTNDHEIEVVNTFNEVNIHYDELLEYDFTSLFSLYVNKTAVEVTDEMIDLSELQNVEIGKSYKVTLNYSLGISKISHEYYVNIVDNEEIVINTKNLVIYPNSEFIDLTTLFEVFVGGKKVSITKEMVTGEIDYTKTGTYLIVLNYDGTESIATVEVKKGVVIDYRYSDTITIVSGTNQTNYDFGNDFRIVVNGTEMNLIPLDYLDVSEVDFSTPGSYEAKITIPYNDKAYGLSGVKFTYHEKTINYVVVNNNFEITILEDLVLFPKGTSDYDVYDNVKVKVNGKNQTLTEIPEYASVIACYVQTISKPIDFTKTGLQKIEIAVYVNGPENDPVIISYNVMLQTELSLVAEDKVIYTGDTLYTRDLFTITQDGEVIKVTNEMITGKVNSFVPGVYNISINYEGLEEVARVVVLDRGIIGTYKTLLRHMSSTSTGFDDEEVVTEGSLLPDLEIFEDGTIKIFNRIVKIKDAINENILKFDYLSNEYTMYYEDGIVSLVPNNDIRLNYNIDKRPMIYFNSEKYQILERMIINSSDTYVLENNVTCYSIDAFKLQNNNDYQQKWFGLKVALTSKMSTDTIYEVTWGEIDFADDFVNDINKSSSLILNGETCLFKVITKGNAKAYTIDNSKVFASMTFNGIFEGKNAVLFVDQYGGYTLNVDGNALFRLGTYELGQMKNGGVNLYDNSVLLYSYNEEIFAYKFILDLEEKTFEICERDVFFGKYQYDKYTIFIDGYGTGIFKDSLKSYYQYQFTYSLEGKELNIEFFNTDYKFLYGDKATFYMEDFGNTLTCGYFEDPALIGQKFENQKVLDGAIVRVHIQKLGADTDTNAKNELYKNIEIITKDGVITGSDLKNYVTTSFIRFNTPGFYEFNIKVDVRGKEVTGYYGIQILENVYSDNILVGTYNGLTTSASLIIDKYGYSIVNYAGEKYEGLAIINEDNSFIINAYTKKRVPILLSGNLLEPGIMKVRCSGSVSFNDYLTMGTKNIIGCEGVVLRSVQIGTRITYILSTTTTNLGQIVTVDILSGSNELSEGVIIKINDENKEIIVKVIKWGDEKAGLVISDKYRGSYMNDKNDTLEIDGFGKAIFNGTVGKYDLNGNTVTVVCSESTTVYRLNNETYTFEVVDIALDNSLLQGKILGSSYNFLCNDYLYLANTTFEFQTNGVVVIRSTSSAHDEGEDMCTGDKYSPKFGSATGVKGTYIVNGNMLTIKVNGCNFEFKIKNVLKANELVCTSTSLSEDEHGYFKIGTIFK